MGQTETRRRSSLLRGMGQRKYSVMMTGFHSEADKAVVEELGGMLTESMTDCTVLVAESMKRTVKLVCMVARGIPVVDQTWIKQSRAVKRFLDPWDFILRNPIMEKKWSCKLEDTLKKASQAGLLTGHSIHVTLQVCPPPSQFKDIIQSAGGVFLPTLPTKAAQGLYCVSCPLDKAAVARMNKLGIPVMDKEWILAGILQYRLDPK